MPELKNTAGACEVINNPILEAHDRYIKDGTDYKPVLREISKESGDRLRQSIRERANSARPSTKQRYIL